MITNKGAINKRPGTRTITLPTVAYTNGYAEHMMGYQTMGRSPKLNIAASVFLPAIPGYSPYVFGDAGSGTSAITDIRNVNGSSLPIEMATSSGKLYYKGFTDTHGKDPLQSAIYNAVNNTTTYWGILGPTVPTAVSAGTASTYTFTVNYGWYYVYTWKTLTGQESNRSPLQLDPSKTSSSTGAIANACPSVIVQGHADTVNVPTISIYRSTDGGGNFYKVEDITNTGSGNITYVDRNYPDGLTVPAQPYPDAALDTTKISPTLVSNSPPPAVAFEDTAIATLNGAITNSATTLTLNGSFNGQAIFINGVSIGSVKLDYTITIDQEQIKVTTVGISPTIVRGINGTVAKAHANGASVRYTPITGIDPPQQCTPIVKYASRLWYGIGNILFYSGNEEISAGVPEECWPSGLNGNFYRFTSPITNVIATSEALYIICTESISWLKGYTKDSFQVVDIFTDIGGIVDHPRSICTADKSIVFLTSDYRVCMARGLKRDFLSDQLSSEIKTAIQTNLCKITLCRHQNQEKDLLVVLAAPPNQTGTLSDTLCKQWVYDFNQSDSGLWNAPWNIPAMSAVSAPLTVGTGTSANYLFWGCFLNAQNGSVSFTDFTFATSGDFQYGATSKEFSCFYTISLVRNPTGNHVNMLREPGMVSVLHAIKLDRTKFTSDTDPVVTYYLDNSTGSGGTSNSSPEIPPRRVQSTGYTTLWYMVNTACERVSVKFAKAASAERFETQMIAFIFSPDSGA